ncbi:endonuclease/exonuclease/phosphatase family protein [Streptacidiphilus pinicola]|uniref:endonuclease/exonuclease/phosphatase family protein n=1 Tax=Streptacidiphilus pinicola TaxID=2219663 RepID=UPI001402EE6C|nr:endonuclease/exonuclease/phosphatase family protein [Streptacidiphilus pinicola]
MSFNTLYNEDPFPRLRALAEVLADADYDVVCLQELWNPRSYALIRALTRTSYPYAAHGARLPLLAGGLLTLSRIPIAGHRFTRLAAGGPFTREALTRKGVLVTRLSVGEELLVVANVHLSANLRSDWSKEAPFAEVQRAELARLAQVVRGQGGAGGTVVAVGDFNVPRDSWLLEGFAADSGLRDAFHGDSATTYRPTPRWSGAALDQVLATPGLPVAAELVLRDTVKASDGWEGHLSDHYGVAATIG